MTARTARIVWIPPEQGGCKTPPSGPRYSAPARFEAAWDAWPDEVWSLVLDLISGPAGSAEWIADVHFLVDDAPQELLSDGARFDLYEGAKCVAHGTVLAAQDTTANGANKQTHVGR